MEPTETTQPTEMSEIVETSPEVVTETVETAPSGVVQTDGFGTYHN